MNQGSILCFLLFIHASLSYAQTPDYSEHIAPIVYKNCSSCHRSGGIAPFSLTSYTQVKNHASGISNAVSSGIMPPWSADTNSVRYVHERALTQSDVQKIVDWVNGGTPEGNPALAPKPPVYNTNYALGNPDLQVKAPLYKSKASVKDEYVCYSIPTNLNVDKWVKGIEVIPGNSSMVHHCLVYIDEAGTYPTDTIGGDCGGPTSSILLGEFTPGSIPHFFPNDNFNKFGVKLKAGAKLVLAMHYPLGSYGKLDSTKVNLHFYPDGSSGLREVYAASVLSNWSFCIAANTKDTVYAEYPAAGKSLPAKISVLGVFPHMHLLGKEMKTWAITPTNDTIDLGNINKYDFEWQGFYTYRKLQILPLGSRIYGSAIYENTSANTNNPNSPIKQVCAGENTSDEMFLIFFQYMLYTANDENIDIEKMVADQDATSGVRFIDVNSLNAFPNPIRSNEYLQINAPNDTYALTVVDVNGKVLLSQNIVHSNAGPLSIAQHFDAGIYFISLQASTQNYVTKVVVVE